MRRIEKGSHCRPSCSFAAIHPLEYLKAKIVILPLLSQLAIYYNIPTVQVGKPMTVAKIRVNRQYLLLPIYSPHLEVVLASYSASLPALTAGVSSILHIKSIIYIV